MNTVRLDKILDDLEKEKKEDFPKCKVKKLIKQFSGSDSECDVELWTNKRSDFSREDVDSNKLSRLLDELVKVTCAPILTPGLTSSLISTNLIDEEIIKLLPTRQRRHSDSDYDVPIPHKSFINQPKKENSPENIIGSTRFFGPILNSTDNNRNYEK
uniref:Uncharacterized protein n=1 Tax=Anoplophora glabripennis TaxID=217634 RepID=V5GTE5_ANOGL